jgi:hypothetical protein
MPIKSITYFKLAALALLIGGFLFQSTRNVSWVIAKLGRPITTNEDIWLKNNHGDLAAYSNFLKQYLFVQDYPEHVLMVPNKNKTNVSFIRKFWLGIPPLYLLPVKVIQSEGYKFEFPRRIFDKLMDLSLISTIYPKNKFHKKSRRFHILNGLKVENFKTWAIYVYEGQNCVDVFTLPMGYDVTG